MPYNNIKQTKYNIKGELTEKFKEEKNQYIDNEYDHSFRFHQFISENDYNN